MDGSKFCVKMGLIKHRRKPATRKPRLTLKVKVVQAQNVDLFKDFKCNPTCVVTTNSLFSKRTNKLKSSKTKWNETLKMKLPSNPQSEWLRVVIYDALPTTSAVSGDGSDAGSTNDDSATSLSAQSSNTVDPSRSNSQVGSNSSKGSQNSYLYVGEAKLSLLDLFKRRDTLTSYRFSIEPTWYRIYDKRLQRQLKDKSELPYVVGEVQLGFKLSTSSKHMSTIQAYNQWRNSLVGTLNHKRSLRRSHPSRPSLNRSSSYPERVYPDENFHTGSDFLASKDDDDDVESRVEYSDNDLYDQDEFTSENNLFSDMISLDSDVASLADGEDMAEKDIASMVPVLDEYEVVDPDLISRISQLPLTDDEHEDEDDDDDDDDEEAILEDHVEDLNEDIYNESFVDLGDEDDVDEYEDDETDNFTVKHTGSRLPRLRRNRRSNRIPSHFITPCANYKLSKKQHALGVVFLEFRNIKDLPSLKNKVSRRIYEMDPFIIAMFGRRVFKTSWKKQSLNPVYNECAAFEVFPDETHFGFHFNVVDKDSFSANDKIAHCGLTWSEMIAKQTPDNDWIDYDLPLSLTVEPQDVAVPTLSVKMKFMPYAVLKKFFWLKALTMHTSRTEFNIVDLALYLDNLGYFTVDEVCEFFSHYGKKPWAGETLTSAQLTEFLQDWKKSSGFKNVWKCPNCSRSCKPTRNMMNTKLVLENDLITHFAACNFERDRKLLKPSYVSSDFASKRWFSKVLIKLTYGKYALGSNNANILVQDRDSGVILEEKISAHVKLGMRIIYNGKGKESKKFRALLKSLSIRQGKKFDDPASIRQIAPFIKFHSLDMAEYEECPYKTFNDFFYRRLKAGARKPEGNNKIFLSPADSRCTVFSSVHQAKDIWIKGSRFSLARLTKNYKPDIFNDRSCSIMIFRLAPQDYHRFHSPCDATIGKPIYVDGQYYTVNPMAVRSSLDVFGENVRMILPMESPEFGPLLLIPVGAMMVGSIVLDREEGEFVKRGEEMGYFKFGGSTIVVVIPTKSIALDSDLSKNSADGIETLVKVGMSVGHSPSVPEHKREKVKVTNPAQMERIKRTISISQENATLLNNTTWEYQTLRNILQSEYGKPGVDSFTQNGMSSSDLLMPEASPTDSSTSTTTV